MSVRVMKTENSFGEVLNENIYHQSFHRFCDDLCGEILIFLPINYKIRLECVSKQFQRCLIQKQTILEISDNDLSRNNFKDCLLKKCWNNIVKYIGNNMLEKVSIYNLRSRKLVKFVKKFKFINEIKINKTRLSKMARENALYIITAFCH
jgi:hypothetical protein